MGTHPSGAERLDDDLHARCASWLAARVPWLAALRQREAGGADNTWTSDVGVLIVAAEPFDLLGGLRVAAATGRVVPRLMLFGIYESADGHIANSRALTVRRIRRRLAIPEFEADPRF